MKTLTGDHHRWEAPASGSALALGVFDGVHRGHRLLIERVTEEAKGAGLVPGVVTFDRHPLAVVDPDRAPRLLTTIPQRLDLLADLGIHFAAVLTFDERLRHLDPASFVTEILVDALGARLVAAGSEFRFGHGRSGDTALLASLGGRLGFELAVVDLLLDGSPISASRIRAALDSGEVADAARGLGRPYELRGTVVRGDGRGRAIGFPTANLQLDPAVLVPARGVYAVTASLGERSFFAVTNIGIRPTFGGTAEVVEAHLLDFDEDIYGSELRLHFVVRLRGEQRFDGVEALVAQIARDVAAARSALEAAP
jgi:riboflavin kinase/FMN adenylyltransferase